MRVANSVFVFTALLAILGCANKERNASIEEMNKGIEAARNNNYNTGITHLKEATRIYPENHQAWYTLGQIYADEKKWEEAIDALGEAVKHRGEDPMYQMRLGIVLYEFNKKDLAQTHLTKAVELENRLARAHYYLGQIHEDKDDAQNAASSWTLAAKLDPHWGKPFIRLGRLYLLWDMIPQAVSVLNQGTLHVMGDDRTDVFYYLGLAYDAQQDWDKAIQAYSQAIDADKANLDAKLQRGLAYARKGDKSKARADLQEYVKSAADTGAASFTKQEANKALMTLLAE